MIASAGLALFVSLVATDAALAEGRAGTVSGVVIPAATGRPDARHDGDSVLVRFVPAATAAQRSQARGLIAGTLVREYRLVHGLEHLRLGPGPSVDQAIGILRRVPVVEYAQPNHVVYLSVNPNDAYFAEQWALHNTGKASSSSVWPAGTADADIDGPEAWNAAAGAGSVVAVIDTGIDYRHSDLAANL